MKQKKIISNIHNRNIRKDLTNKIHKIIKSLKLETVKTYYEQSKFLKFWNYYKMKTIILLIIILYNTINIWN
jgi:hypothetical protein